MKATANHTAIQLPLAIEGEPFELPLTRGYVAIIDAIDADLAALKWTAHPRKTGRVYVSRCFRIDGIRKRKALHQVILERILGRPLVHPEECDHVDLNPLNNRRSNLRLATRSQQSANRALFNSTSGFKGVYFDNATGYWRAHIKVHGKRVFLGYYENAEEGGIAYNVAALKYFGEFARVNDIPDWQLRIPSRVKRPLLQRNNTSGHPNISKHSNHWVATIRVNGKQIYIGTYKTIEEAFVAQSSAKSAASTVPT